MAGHLTVYVYYMTTIYYHYDDSWVVIWVDTERLTSEVTNCRWPEYDVVRTANAVAERTRSSGGDTKHSPATGGRLQSRSSTPRRQRTAGTSAAHRRRRGLDSQDLNLPNRRTHISTASRNDRVCKRTGGCPLVTWHCYRRRRRSIGHWLTKSIFWSINRSSLIYRRTDGGEKVSGAFMKRQICTYWSANSLTRYLTFAHLQTPIRNRRKCHRNRLYMRCNDVVERSTKPQRHVGGILNVDKKREKNSDFFCQVNKKKVYFDWWISRQTTVREHGA